MQRDEENADQLEQKAAQKESKDETAQAELSKRAYDLIGKGTELIRANQYDDALELYEEALRLFEQLNWATEIEKIRTSINEIEEQGEQYHQELLEKREKTEELSQKELESLATLDRRAEILRKKRARERQEKLDELKQKKLRDEEFKNMITDMVNDAEKTTRDYENTIKRGKFEVECPYATIVEVYETIRLMLVERDWEEESKIYEKPVNLYKEKLEKDKKLREIEEQKVKKKKEFDESRKIKEIDFIEATLDSLENESRFLEYEDKKRWEEYQTGIVFKMLDDAERASKDYELAKKKGNILELEAPYENIIKKYEQAQKKFEEMGWEEQATQLFHSIQFYQEKIVKDKILREFERKKEEQ